MPGAPLVAALTASPDSRSPSPPRELPHVFSVVDTWRRFWRRSDKGPSGGEQEQEPFDRVTIIVAGRADLYARTQRSIAQLSHSMHLEVGSWSSMIDGETGREDMKDHEKAGPFHA